MRVSTRSRVAHSADRAINIAEHELAPRTSATIEREDGQADGWCVQRAWMKSASRPK
jgi:hypothetical protein